MTNDGLALMAKALWEAHVKYMGIFDQPIHGTEKQFAALLELCPQARSAITLWDKQRLKMKSS
jgi:hypothetical protein